MEPPFDTLVEALSRPDAYPEGVREARGDPGIERLQTHISVVFLVGERAYKLKKPRDLGFLDFTTPERRRHFAHEEVRLNRRLAPHVYEGVVPVLFDGGTPRFSDRLDPDPESDPETGAVDWAVRMVRLPEDRSLRALLRAGRIGRPEIFRLADRLADFHRTADAGPEISRMGSWDTVSANDQENFEQLRPFVGGTIGARVHRRLEGFTRAELAHLRPLIERRARSGMPRDTHGDLRLGHVYLLPSGTPGTGTGGGADEIVIIDCIEFNKRFRWADPVSDLAFLVMELEFEGRAELAGALSDRYFEAAGDREGARLLPYYTSYRDIVRGKVRSLETADSGVPEEDRRKAGRKAVRHFLLALGRLAPPGERPALVLVAGLPGVGKSTLARALARGDGFAWIDTDRVRKELASAEGAGTGREPGGEGSHDSPPFDFGEGLYSPEWTERTYGECARRAREHLFEGGRVLVEGSFRREAHRTAFLELARELGVPALILHCEVTELEARRRLAARPAGPSDADWKVHREMAARWEEPGEATARQLRGLPLDGPEEEAVPLARALLAREGLTDQDGS